MGSTKIERNYFGNVVKDGWSMETYNRGRLALERVYPGIEVVSYSYCREAKQLVNSEKIDKSRLNSCSICNKPLHVLTFLDDDVFYKERRHLIFKTNTGEEFPVCYKLNQCIDRSNVFIDENDIDFEMHSAGPPDLFKLLEIDDVSGLNDPRGELFIQSARQDYQCMVYPFLKKWMRQKITKSNVYEFMKDYKKASVFATNYLDTGIGRMNFEIRLMEILGIKVGE